MRRVLRTGKTLGLVMVGVVLGSSGLAIAANGGAFVLGHSNYETSPSLVTNSSTGLALGVRAYHGVPLKLYAPSGVAPLNVTSSVEVPGLNANYVGGLAAGALQRRVAGTCATAIRAIYSSGQVGCRTPDSWTAITQFSNGWATYSASDPNYPALQYSVDANNIVHLRGDIFGGTASPAFCFPTNLAPAKAVEETIATNTTPTEMGDGGGNPCISVALVTGATRYSLDGVSWPAGM